MKNKWIRLAIFILVSSAILSGTISTLGWFGRVGLSIMFGYLVGITMLFFIALL